MIDNPITPIYVEKMNANDDSYLLAEILFTDGAYIRQDEQIARIETSKAIFELLSPVEGYIYFNPSLQGNEIAPNSLFAIVVPTNLNTQHELKSIFSNLNEKIGINQSPQTNESKFSKKALELIEKHNLDLGLFSGKSVVMEKDVQNYLKHKN
jgi:pyruvate/2-oxoglutarate dehydrogenase complex dihydrolipoamide acyltransferase (E2) component